MKFERRTKIKDDQWFDIIVYAIATVILIMILYPLLFVVSASFSDPSKVIGGEMWLLPKGFTLDAYKEVFETKEVWTGYKNTIIYTVLGTLINITLTTLAAYPLSRKDLPGRSIFMFIIAFTMFFSGGLIPTYLLVQSLGMVDTIWSMMIPTAIATYNLIVMRTYFQTSIPWELQEAALMDGSSNTRLLVSIILPLSKPIIAVMVLFYAVGHWNAYFNALIYLNSEHLYPLQIILRNILITNQNALMEGDAFGLGERLLLAESIKYSLIIVASIPVLLIYPFVQRHFIKGVMIGSLKG
ncbi:carbohydrate ABC transporter permease [Paenibacillus arenilitoris]|uniref:Carbohydrate ABC transporter permease n=1 Tax=Paenibacillus arenilitoris TaxID=2772299 RepID=A0A927H3D0_9BACL|nr:carbohydrate ABC transporter permease [Paenibacillus arenilitoris]MBD2867196.1 carbohydrate ABC transporter permease [Paenibacillus arenilitoris]